LEVVVLEVFDEYMRGIVNFHLSKSLLAQCFKLVDVGFEMRGLIVLEVQNILYVVVRCAVLHTVHILTMVWPLDTLYLNSCMVSSN
jgi:hypothetical protein